jgi:hypothetical protein
VNFDTPRYHLSYFERKTLAERRRQLRAEAMHRTFVEIRALPETRDCPREEQS